MSANRLASTSTSTGQHMRGHLMGTRSTRTTAAAVAVTLAATLLVGASSAVGDDSLSLSELAQRQAWTPEERRAHGEELLPDFEDVARVESTEGDPEAPVPEPGPMPARAPVEAAMPEPGVASLEVGSTVSSAQAGQLPVSVRAMDSAGDDAPLSDAAEGSRHVEVEVLDQDVAEAADVAGLLLRVTEGSPSGDEGQSRASTPSSTGQDASTEDTAPVAGVELSIDYGDLAGSYGGGWASRLRLVELPECALTTPQEPECVDGKPVESINDVEAQRLTATLASPSSTVMAMRAGASGSGGDWSATSLAPSASWDVSGSTGNFSWSYPLRVPPAAAGPAPELALGYSSSSLDGRVASSNNQSSWIGDGWDLSSGYIERKYVPCSQDDSGGANNADHPTGDLCWDSDNATMLFGGSAVELVKDAATGTWRPERDDATRVERLTDGFNGDNDKEYWKVTTTDGTQYFFGRGQRSATDATALGSAWWVPVFGNHPGEPCYASSFAASSCTQVWRWNLDYVVDTSGNTMTYTYAAETNRYGKNNNTSTASYVRGGYLTSIQYGQRQGAETSSSAPARVDFTVSERCLTTSSQTCDTLNSGSAAAWPDVPADLICSSTTSCPDVGSPAFFTRKRLTTVTTKALKSGSYQAVDSWSLAHTFPDPGDSEDPILWLDTVTHAGHAGGTVTLPAVDFGGEQMANRVDPSGTFMPMNRFRLTTIRSESGAMTTVTYSPQDCTTSSLPASPETNTRRCFPVRWTPEGTIDPLTEYFHKYLVTGVVDDPRGYQPEQVETTYDYLGGAAWRYTDDPMVKKADRTWAQFRGYATVDVTTGEVGSSTPGRTRYRYFRGMDGDRTGSGGSRSVEVDGVTDHDQFAGMPRETITYNGTGSTVVEKVTRTPWRSVVKASDGDGRKAYQVGTQEIVTATTAPNVAGGVRETSVRNSFNSYGKIYRIHDAGDVARSGDERCTNLTLANNTTQHIIGVLQREEVLSAGCGDDVSRPADVISDTRYWFDGQSYGVVPTRGLVTRTDQLKAYSGSTPTYIPVSRTTYDALGRTTAVTDALGRTSTTAYTPAGAGAVTSVKTTSPDPDGAGPLTAHVSTAVMDPAWGNPTKVTDPNGKVTEATYDALGRLTKVWKPGRAKASETPHLEYAYTVRSTGHNAVSTKTLDANNTYRTTVAIYDGLLRSRQTQTDGANRDIGGRVITETLYDSRGLVEYEVAAWATDGAPGTVAVSPTEAVPTRTRTVHDGAGRVTAQVFEVNEIEQWRTTTSYGGDRVTVDPPTGGTPTTTITDARGRTTTLRQYLGTSPADAHQDTTYRYDKAGNLAEVRDVEGNVWTYTHDLLGRQVAASDPDKGSTTFTFDDAGQMLSTTDARGETIVYTYDQLGRTTERRSGTAMGTLLASWTYDTIAKGQVSTGTRHVGSAKYVTAVTSYDDGYRPAGQSVTLPSTEGALAGTYSITDHYTDSGHYRGVALPALANLPAENVVTYYDEAAMPEWMTGAGGQGVYVATTRYTSTGKVEAMDLGNTRSYVMTHLYDPGTRRLTGINLDQEGVSGTNLAATYSYDQAGNVTQIDNKPTVAGGPARDTQCFTYDGLRRLTSAWTPSSASCATTKSTAVLGGPAKYWVDYTYDPVGNRTTAIDRSTTTTNTANYTYPATGEDRPHAVTQVTQGSQISTYGYDAAGNTTTRAVAGQPAQGLEWDVEGELAEVTELGQTAATFVYTADGERLVRKQDGVTTVYLPGGQELTLTGSTKKATRYYNFAGQTIAVRDGTSMDDVDTLVADHHGTASLSISNVSAKVTYRYSTPFGDTRGTTPTAWTGDHGFLDKPADATGLTAIGARYYDPGIGRFISVDPIMDLADPQQWAAYNYSNNNPATWSDPTGMIFEMEIGIATGTGRGDPDTTVSEPDPQPETVKPPVVTTSSSSDPGHEPEPSPSPQTAPSPELSNGPSELPPLVTFLYAITVEDFVNCLDGNKDGGCVWLAVGFIPVGGKVAKGVDLTVDAIRAANKTRPIATRAAADAANTAGRSADDVLEAAGAACRRNSFDAGTLVLMADGSHKAIEDVDLGDEVIATDPKTGEQGPRKVIDLIRHGGVHTMVDVELSDGSQVDATDEHPFWVVSENVWVDAIDLEVGDVVTTADGTTLKVTSAHVSRYDLPAYNLTIADLHTYHVGTADVLVHNSGGMDGCSDAAYQGVLHIRDEIAAEGAGGSHSWASNMSDDALADYLDGFVTRGGGQPLRGGGQGWYDQDLGVAIVQRSEYSMTGYSMSYQKFLEKLG